MKQTRPKAKNPNPPPAPKKVQVIPSMKKNLAYDMALIDPFNPRAAGARVPDMYSFPTETAVVHTTFTINTDASGSCSAVVLPCLEGTVIGVATNVVGGDRTPFVTGAVNGQYSSVSESLINRNNAINLKTFRQRYASTRIVGVGYRLKPLVSYTDAAGKLIVASVPATFNTNPVLPNHTTSQDDNLEPEGGGSTPESLSSPGKITDAIGIPVDWSGADNHIQTSILSLPVSREVSLTELVEQRGLEAAAKVTSPHAFEFMNTDPYYNTVSVTVGASGDSFETVPSRLGADLYDSRGFSSLLLRGSGLKASTPVFEVEVIFHLENIPRFQIASTSYGFSTFSSASASAIVDIPAFHSALQRAAQTPFFRFMQTMLEGTSAGRIGMRAVRALGLLPG